MGVEKTSSASSGKLNKSSSVDVYIPPALRKSLELTKEDPPSDSAALLETKGVSTTDANNTISEARSNEENGVSASNNQSPVSTNGTRTVRRERRPDRAVYIPRARRSLTTPPHVNTTPEQSSLTTSITSQSPTSKTNSIKPNNNQKRNIDRDSTTITTGKENSDTPRISSSCENNKLKTDKTNRSIASHHHQNTLNPELPISSDPRLDKICDKVERGTESLDSTNLTTTNIANMSRSNDIVTMNGNLSQDVALRIEDVIDSKKPAKGDNDVEELQRASKEINRSNRRIIKQTFNSDILEIPDSIRDNQKNGVLDITKENKIKSVDPENDDWDSMFDDNGECVDPKILEELTASVGKVKIETPKADYKAYHLKQSILNDEEFPHVLEASNFPVEFKTQDLMMAFSQYKESGFDIKWVDDTHALAVFSSSRIAAEVLAMGHPFVQLKPLAEATVESRAKAKKCSSSLQPYRPRPETCAALARRLVTGALGVRLKTAAEERENEKRVLREAKERKLLAAKQRDEAWES